MEFLGRNIDVFDFDLEILPRAERILFLLNLAQGNEDTEIVFFPALVECLDDALYFLVGEVGALVLRALDFLLRAEVRGVHEQCLSVGRSLRVKEQHGDVGARVREDVGGHGDHAAQEFFLDDIFPDFQRDARGRGEESRRDDDSGFAFRAVHRAEDMLKE